MATRNDLSGRQRVTLRRIRRERLGGAATLSVLCPQRGQLIDVVECRDCDHSRGLCRDDDARELFLRCIFTPSGAESAGHTMSGTPLSEIATLPARCVEADSDLYDLLARLVEAPFGAAPVVNSEGQPIGVVTKSDVLRCYYEHEERLLCPAEGEAGAPAQPPTPDVRAIMSHVVFSLPADSDVNRAAALMAYEGVHHVVLTGDDGRAVGIVSSLDILRWLARQGGPLDGEPGAPIRRQ